jgi:hypothetical protein
MDRPRERALSCPGIDHQQNPRLNTDAFDGVRGAALRSSKVDLSWIYVEPCTESGTASTNRIITESYGFYDCLAK